MSEGEVIEGEVLEKKPRKKRKERRVRDKMFVDEYLRNGGNATKAAWAVTDVKTRGSAQVAGSRLLNRNLETIESRMTKFGLTDELVMTKHKDLVSSENDNVAMKAVETYYKVTKKEGGSDQNITVHFNF
jgi:phage terminase small subunit